MRGRTDAAPEQNKCVQSSNIGHTSPVAARFPPLN